MHIFMSYRRSDGISYLLPIIKRRLEQRFGDGSAFFDVDDIPLGIDFREHINSHLDKATLVLAFIGDSWLGEEPNGVRRIDDDSDFVRIEIEISLAKKIPLIPVFTNNATNKILSKLPVSIEPLKFRNGLELRSGPNMDAQFDILIQKLSVFSPNMKMDMSHRVEKIKAPLTERGETNIAIPIDEFKLPIKFSIILGKTYYRSGMVNPGPEASKSLGAHGTMVSVKLGSSGKVIQSKINRAANANGSVRLIGNNSEIADWFQSNFLLSDVVSCSVIGAQDIIFHDK
jgi:TIR domain